MDISHFGLFLLGAAFGFALGFLVFRRLAALGSVTVTSVTCLSATEIRIQGSASPGTGERLVGLHTFVDNDPNATPLASIEPGATPHPAPSGNAFDLSHVFDPVALPGENLAVVWAEFASPSSPGKKKFGPCSSGTGTGSGSGLIVDSRPLFESAPRSYLVRHAEKGSSGPAELDALTLHYDQASSLSRPVWRSRNSPAVRCSLEVRKEGDAVLAIFLCVPAFGAGHALRWATDRWSFQGRNTLKFLSPEPLAALTFDPT